MNIFDSFSYFEKSTEGCLFQGFSFDCVVIRFQIVVEVLITIFNVICNSESASLASTEIEAVPPNFIQHLSPAKEVMEGSRVRLDCILVGHPEPEVIWYKNDKPVKESKDIQLLFEGDRCTLCIREAYLEDSGTYRIVANNVHGQAESLCKLHVERECLSAIVHCIPGCFNSNHPLCQLRI